MGQVRYVDVLLYGGNCHLSNLLTGCIENYRFAFAVHYRQVVHYGVRGNTGTSFQVSTVAYADDLGVPERTVQVDLLEAVVSHLAGQWRIEVRVVVLAEAGLIGRVRKLLVRSAGHRQTVLRQSRSCLLLQ